MSNKLNFIIFKINQTPYISILFFLLCCVLNYVYLITYSINIPFMDEWELFRPNSFINNPTLQNLFAQHNEHKLVIPKVFFYIFSLFNYDIRVCLTISYMIFTLCVILVFKRFKLSNFYIMIWSLVLFSPLNFENNLWPFQIQWHLLILFILLSIMAICKNNKTSFTYLGGVFLPFATVFSLGSGAIAALLLSVISFLRSLMTPKQNDQKSDIYFSIIYTSSSILFSILYFYNYQKPPYHPEISFPWTSNFWKHFFAILSLGYGNINLNFTLILGLIIFLLILNCIVFAIKSYFSKKSKVPSQEELIILALVFTAMLATISLTRAGFGANQALSSRYFEFSAFNILALVTLNYSSKINKLKILGLIFLIIFTINNLNFEKFYKPASTQRLSGKECLREVIKFEKNKICSDLYPESLFEVIKYLKLNNKNYIFLNDF